MEENLWRPFFPAWPNGAEAAVKISNCLKLQHGGRLLVGAYSRRQYPHFGARENIKGAGPTPYLRRTV